MKDKSKLIKVQQPVAQLDAAHRKDGQTNNISRSALNCMDRIRAILRSARSRALQTVNSAMIIAYWNIGKEIVEEEQRGKKRADYGRALLERLSLGLKKEFGKGYSVQNLRRIRQFYLVYKDRGQGKRSTLWSGSESLAGKGKNRKSPISESRTNRKGNDRYSQSSESESQKGIDKIRSSLMSESRSGGRKGKILYTLGRDSSTCAFDAFLPDMSWTHYQILMRIEDAMKRKFYEVECSKARWSVRELERQIASLLYERLAISRDKIGVMALAQKGHDVFAPEDLIKDPYVLEFTGLPEPSIWQEGDLEQALIDRLQNFLLELGKDLFFVARQKRITVDGDQFYIDLVFYHRILRCFLLIDLKVGRLTQADMGQMLLYTGYYESEEQFKDENPPIGLILCTDKNEAAVRYTMSNSAKKVFASRYQLHLPSEEELSYELIRERADIERKFSEEE